MNFTREPIIETIITPKEGYKLLVRNTKGSTGEEYVVDALEVVSFGHSFFFRSTERPKSFLVPVSDYEISETKETRVVLKNATFERNIKIGGGAKVKEKVETEEAEPEVVEQRLEKKRERRRHRRRRGSPAEEAKSEETKPAEKPVAEGGGAQDEIPPSSSVVKRLIPPPPGLISESIKQKSLPKVQEDVSSDDVKETPKKEERPHREMESGDVQRIAIETPEFVTTTSFSTLRENIPFGKIW